MNKKLSRLVAFFAIALLAVIITTPNVSAYGNCNYQGNGCYGCTTGSWGYGGSYGYNGYYQEQYRSSWNQVRLKYHYPYSSGGFSVYSNYNQFPGPYAHRY